MTIGIIHSARKLGNGGKRGFSLTEVAIVLGIIGALTAAIWGVASNVYENNAVTTVVQQISKITGNIRDTYTALATWPTSGTCSTNGSNNWAAVPTDVTKCFDGNYLFPTDMRNSAAQPGNSTMSHALSGTISILDETFTIANPVPTFRIKLFSLKPSACAKLLSQLPFNDASFGFVQVLVNGTSEAKVTSYSGGVPSWNTVPPFAPVIAAGWCGLTGNTNEVDIDLRLHN
jgi:prepilin-type N-terminal cleavage/methylation domain-containing protein